MRYVLMFLICKVKRFVGVGNKKKVYSGKYHNGDVFYEYTESGRGRIFNGRFLYLERYATGPFASGKKCAQGTYDGDKKNGKWVYLQSDHDGRCKLIAHYKDGVLNGDYAFSGRGSNMRQFQNRFMVKFSMHDGKPVGSYYANLLGGTMRGMFDDEGHADGLWTFDYNKKPQKDYEEWSHGRLIDSYSIDNSTGRRRSVNEYMQRTLSELIAYESCPLEKTERHGCTPWDGDNMHLTAI